MSNSLRVARVLVPLVLVAAPVALAQFTVTFVAPFHGQPCTDYASWESFTDAAGGPNAPDDPATTSLDSAVLQLAAGGVVTTAGNLDDQTVPPVYRITDAAPADVQEVVLQVAILLNQMNWASFTLSYQDSTGATQSLPPSTSSFLTHLMGRDERLITWDLSAIADTITSYRIDFAAPNTFTQLDAVKLDVRYECVTGATPFCAGDGLDPAVTTPCPCGNSGAPGRGCANSVNASGALLATTTAGIGGVVLAGSGMPGTVSCIYLQGDAIGDATFGDGVRCADGNLIRLRTKTNVGGASSFPDSTDTITLAQRGGVTPGSGVSRFYQTYYRNAAPLFCPPETFNVTNGQRIVW